MRTEYILLLVAALVCGTYGLKCYTCDGHDLVGEEDECQDTFDTKGSAALLKECNSTAKEIFCRKQKKGLNNLWTNLERGCAAQCEEQNLAYVKRVTCCQTDGCNGASAVTITVVSVFGAAILSSVAFWK